MKKIAFLSDVIFSFFVSFLFIIFLFRYWSVALLPSLILATLCGGLTAVTVYAVLQIKRKTLYLKKSDERLKEKLLLHLALLSDEEKTQYFQRALSTSENLANRFGRLRIFTKTEFYFLKFSLAPIEADEIPALSRFKTGKTKVLLCAQMEESALSLCSRLGIAVKTGEWVYTLFKERNLLPERYLGDTPVKQKSKHKLWFAKHNAKRFLVSGSLILLLSYLTPFYYYYLLVGVLLLFAAVLVRILGYE